MAKSYEQPVNRLAIWRLVFRCSDTCGMRILESRAASDRKGATVSDRWTSTHAPLLYAAANSFAASRPTLSALFPRAPIESEPRRQSARVVEISTEEPGESERTWEAEALSTSIP